MIRVAKCLLICVVAGFTLSVLAEDRVVVIWNCELNDGMTQDDVQKLNGRWVKFVNENVAGGDIRSFALTPIVGNTTKFQSAFLVQTTGSSSQMSGLGNQILAFEGHFDHINATALYSRVQSPSVLGEGYFGATISRLQRP